MINGKANPVFTTTILSELSLRKASHFERQKEGIAQGRLEEFIKADSLNQIHQKNLLSIKRVVKVS
jgi:hypothetical protein